MPILLHNLDHVVDSRLGGAEFCLVFKFCFTVNFFESLHFIQTYTFPDVHIFLRNVHLNVVFKEPSRINVAQKLWREKSTPRAHTTLEEGAHWEKRLEISPGAYQEEAKRSCTSRNQMIWQEGKKIPRSQRIAQPVPSEKENTINNRALGSGINLTCIVVLLHLPDSVSHPTQNCSIFWYPSQNH